jgi:hAT family C-terminal dimerisation region
MASSVSSERVFSQGGMAITKRRSCLENDIVEARQCVKSSTRRDLLFREPAPSSALEIALASGDEGEDDIMADDESDY